MDVDSAGPAAAPTCNGVEVSVPAVVNVPSALPGSCSLRLDIPGQDMMDVDPEVSARFGSTLAAAGAHVSASRAGPRVLASLDAPSAANPITRTAPLRFPAHDAPGALGLRPMPTPPVAVVTTSDVLSRP
jgi:hypothetical protein